MWTCRAMWLNHSAAQYLRHGSADTVVRAMNDFNGKRYFRLCYFISSVKRLDWSPTGCFISRHLLMICDIVCSRLMLSKTPQTLSLMLILLLLLLLLYECREHWTQVLSLTHQDKMVVVHCRLFLDRTESFRVTTHWLLTFILLASTCFLILCILIFFVVCKKQTGVSK